MNDRTVMKMKTTMQQGVKQLRNMAIDEYASIPLGNVATFIRGINFKPDDVTTLGTPDTLACMRTKNVQETLDLLDVWAVPKKFAKRADQILQHGDILISSANSWNLVGKCCWIPKLPCAATFGGFVSVLRSDPEKVEPRYLYRWFSSDRVQNVVRSFGRQTTNISNLDISRCLTLPIPLPPIAEQKRIAAILDKAEELRGLRRKALGELDAIVQSIFLEMFGSSLTNPKGWDWNKLGDICAEIYRYPTFYGFEYQATGTPVARIGNILLDGRLDPDTSKYAFIDPTISKQFPRTILEIEDIVMAVRGDGSTAKRIGLVTSDNLIGANISPNLLRFKAKEKVSHPLFLFHFMISDVGQRVLESNVSRTAKKTITAGGIKKIEIPLPPFPLQQEFARRIKAIEHLKTTHRESLAQLNALFASLQHRAFRGEL